MEVKQLNIKQIQSTLVYLVRNGHDRGTYVCEIEDPVTGNNVSDTIELKVLAKPRLNPDKVIAINVDKIYLNWTVESFGSQIQSYTLMQSEEGQSWTQSKYEVENRIPPENTSYVLGGLKRNTTYTVKMWVQTTAGLSEARNFDNVTTLAESPEFVPNISINGFSATSVTIGWAPPPDEIAHLIHYYELTAKKKGDNSTFKTCHSRDSRNLPYMFGNLKPHSTYVFQVQFYFLN